MFRAAVLAVVTVVLLAGIFLRHYWDSLTAEAQARGSQISYLLAEQTTRTFQAVDLTLRGLEPLLTRESVPEHAPDFETLLRRRVAELDFIRLIIVTDATGKEIETSEPGPAHVMLHADRPSFRALADDSAMSVVIGQADTGRDRQNRGISVARRMTAPDGRFNGILLAEIEPRYFAKFFDGLDLGRHATINLYQDNGRTLLASTESSPVPFDRLRLPRTAPGETIDRVSPQRTGWLGARKLVAYHRTDGYPLMVSVGIDTRDLRSRWWAIAGPTLGALVGTIALIVGFAVLINRRRAEQARAQQRAMVMQKLEAMGQMTASVSHDFRNLLTVMSATLRLLRRRGPDEKVFAAAEESIDRGNKLIGQLLAFARRQDLQVAPADINAYVAGLEDVLRHAAGPAVDVRLDLTPGLPLCHTDQTQFDAALMNLVTNARQAMPAAGLITVATGLAEEKATAPGFVTLSVTDTGSGIDEATQKRIFEPFFTTKADGGTGLGLAQVYGFMRQIGGDVRVRSAVGAGTTFTLLFPVHEPDAAARD